MLRRTLLRRGGRLRSAKPWPRRRGESLMGIHGIRPHSGPRRATLKRGPWRKPRPIRRPAPRVGMGKAWRRRAQAIRERDGFLCRRCGHPALNGPVNHCPPRRLLSARDAARPEVLALLDAECHGWVTMVLEPKVYAGDIQALRRFLAVLAKTGPIPSPAVLARAFQKATKALRKDSA